MSLDVQHLTKRYAGRTVVHDVSFQVDGGELVALLGPSGSGKSTILRIVAGLTSADLGRVVVDGIDVTALPPKARDLGFVFQNYALFEHLTVADNVEFALRVRKVGRHDRRLRRDELLEQVGLGGSARKYPGQLSGGQRQRTALARALAHKPRLLLLDEPFGALDARIRQDLRQSLRELLKRLGTTAIFVTHDQEEAFSVADRIMVLHRGRLLEQGAPQQLYRSPRTEFVAGFVGRANLLPGELAGDGVRIRLAGAPAGADAIPQRVQVLLRPERLRLEPADAPLPQDPRVFAQRARVERTEYLGASERIHLAVAAGGEAGGRQYLLEALRSVEATQALPLRPGDEVTVVARQMHAVLQPGLRLLVVAGRDDDSRALVEAALAFGERHRVLVTLLGSAIGDPALHAKLDHYRQAFAGELKLVEVEPGGNPLAAARIHLQGERHDLVLLPATLRDPERLVEFLRATDTPQLLLAGSGASPLGALEDARWSVLLRAFSASQPGMDLLAELAAQVGARVDVRDLDRSVPADQPASWHSALALQRVPFTVTRQPPPGPRDVRIPISEPADLVAIDLGPRAGLDARQQRWLEALRDRWTLLLVQPDEADLNLRPTTRFRRDEAAQDLLSPDLRRILP
ncbi:MAG TPA: ABC transporter ATP-binding protein [Luteimonas sp.]|nr:ABC transporter ATP-binding protein [Luteimonas sp.]